MDFKLEYNEEQEEPKALLTYKTPNKPGYMKLCFKKNSKELNYCLDVIKSYLMELRKFDL